MRVNCREQIANPAEPVNGQDERRIRTAVDSPAAFAGRQSRGDSKECCRPALLSERGNFHDRR